MPLSDLASIGSFVSGAAVLVSLALLYFQLRQIAQQIRQADKNQKAALRTTRASRTMDSLYRLLDADAAQIFRDGGAGSDDMSSTQVTRYVMMCLIRFLNAEDAFYQHEDGLLPETAYESFLAIFRTDLALPGFRASWQFLRSRFRGGFVEFVDELIVQTPVTQPALPDEFAAQWKAAVTAHKARVTR